MLRPASLMGPYFGKIKCLWWWMKRGKSFTDTVEIFTGRTPCWSASKRILQCSYKNTQKVFVSSIKYCGLSLRAKFPVQGCCCVYSACWIYQTAPLYSFIRQFALNLSRHGLCANIVCLTGMDFGDWIRNGSVLCLVVYRRMLQTVCVVKDSVHVVSCAWQPACMCAVHLSVEKR